MSEGYGDFGYLDGSMYTGAISAYQDSLQSAIGSVADKNLSATEKVQKFNEALQGSLGAISAPIIAKGFGKSFINLKGSISKRIKARAQKAIVDAKGKVEEAKGKAQDAVDDAKQKAQDTIDDAKPTDADGVEAPEEAPSGEIQETSFFDKPDELDEFDESRIPEGARGRVSPPPEEDGEAGEAGEAGEGAEAGEAGAEEATAEAGAEAGADAGAEIGAGLGTEVATDTGLATASAVADTTAVAEGGANPIADVVALGLGLGMMFTGLFAKKHAKTVSPPPANTPTFSFGT